MKKITYIFIGILTMLVFIISCSNPDGLLGQVSFYAGTDIVKAPGDADFTQAAVDAEGTGTTSYSSSDTAVATVDSGSGLVSIKGYGTTVITAVNSGDDTYSAVNDSYLLTVKDLEFITTWETTTNNESITIPTTGGGYNYTVDWGDGNIDTGITGDITHIYNASGMHSVKISKTLPRIYFYYPQGLPHDNNYKIRTIENWGIIKWSSMNSAFYGCENLTYNASDNPDLSFVTDMNSMFYLASSFNGNIDSWDVGNIINMYAMFAVAEKFDQDIGSWDVSSVIYMSAMFGNADQFNQDISSWDVSSVIYMDSMFGYTSKFNQDISSWDVSSVMYMDNMFISASSFNQDISSWDVSGAVYMDNMFSDASSFNQNISSWDVSMVKYMSNMFYNATDFRFHDLRAWNVLKVTSENHVDFFGGTSERNGNYEPNWP